MEELILQLTRDEQIKEQDSKTILAIWAELDTIPNVSERFEQLKKRLGKVMGPRTSSIVSIIHQKLVQVQKPPQHTQPVQTQPTPQSQINPQGIVPPFVHSQPSQIQNLQPPFSNQQTRGSDPRFLSGQTLNINQQHLTNNLTTPYLPIPMTHQLGQAQSFSPQFQSQMISSVPSHPTQFNPSQISNQIPVSSSVPNPLLVPPVPPQTQPSPGPFELMAVVSNLEALSEERSSNRDMREEASQLSSQGQTPSTSPSKSDWKVDNVLDLEAIDSLLSAVLQRKRDSRTTMSETAKHLLSKSLQSHLNSLLDQAISNSRRRRNQLVQDIHHRTQHMLHHAVSHPSSSPESQLALDTLTQSLSLKWGPDSQTIATHEGEYVKRALPSLKASLQELMRMECEQQRQSVAPYWVYERDEEQLGYLDWDGLVRSHLRREAMGDRFTSEKKFKLDGPSSETRQPNTPSPSLSLDSVQASSSHISMKSLCDSVSSPPPLPSPSFTDWGSFQLPSRSQPYPNQSEAIQLTDIIQCMSNIKTSVGKDKPMKGGYYSESVGRAHHRIQLGLEPVN